jgi:drug/metabolite transporter (DMT)-like permease
MQPLLLRMQNKEIFAMINSPETTTRISPAVWALLLILGMLWGASFFFARIAVAEIPPLWLVFFRVSIAASALHLYLFASKQWHIFWSNPFLPFLMLGLLNNAIPFSLIFTGQTVIGAGLASILNATTPFLTVIVANLLTRDEKATTNKIAGTLLGIVGAILIVDPINAIRTNAPLWAYLAVIGAALSYAFAGVYAKQFKGISPVVIATGQLSGSTLIMLPAALFVHGTPAVELWHANSWLAAITLALACTAFAYTLFFRIIALSGATTASLVTLLVPVSAVVLGAVFLDERLALHEIGGMALIFVGLIVINGWVTPLRDKPLN